jgi:hypothetical protein
MTIIFEDALDGLRRWASVAAETYAWVLALGRPPQWLVSVAERFDDELKPILSAESMAFWRGLAASNEISVEEQGAAAAIVELLEGLAAELLLQRLDDDIDPQAHRLALLEFTLLLERTVLSLGRPAWTVADRAGP